MRGSVPSLYSGVGMGGGGGAWEGAGAPPNFQEWYRRP